MHGIPYEILEQSNPVYQCTCSKEKTKHVLLGIGEKEVMQLIQEQGTLSVCCQFRKKIYQFDHATCEELFMKQ